MARGKAQHPARLTAGPAAPVVVRKVAPIREWTFEDLAPALQESARRHASGDLTRVTVLATNAYEVRF